MSRHVSCQQLIGALNSLETQGLLLETLLLFAHASTPRYSLNPLFVKTSPTGSPRHVMFVHPAM